MADADLEKALAAWFAERQDAMVVLLADLVNIDSNTLDKKGVDAVGARIIHFLDAAGVQSDIIPHETFGDIIRATVPSGDRNNAPVMLLGHRDTVFPSGEVSRRPFTILGDRAYGPGVADMKGGLVINAFVLAAMAALGIARRPVVGLFTGDEEIASPWSRDVIAREVAGMRAVFNGEPGRPSGNVTVGRKGGLFMRIDVRGRAAHSGSHFSHGISAIEALARKTIRLHALTDLEAGTTVNVGVVGGGLTLNTVAPDAFAELDLRYIEPSERDRMLAAVQAIVDEEDVAGSSAELTITGEFLPLVQSEAERALYAIYDTAAVSLGCHFGEEFSGGCSDAGIPCAQGIATLCGVGPVGGGSHTEEEYIELDTLLTRAQTLALTVARL
ncbi:MULTISPECIES: M20 family metallopeptidase [unclassified Chelatococcus]|jgi:glutamate carboxypeptidase|uniref:M20 family metallopeptidase n=1 Tax=unclassified Chelatococcus TaxID=2638111 RepID=UPI0020C17204|nr:MULTISPECIES: M20 family metallopeptidase [unclassified Chelatococcus]MCO5078543.1 M20 family metallopeptidase [Chelatococcus sp.]CAH1654181.1 Glutamate carboxypeptidase [Hyphomicrobiales bacterium]CAH1685492.1 Glutamate carboxypeptidase [Hyphomicrobiales bacterium]